jgi:hypothetical protein
MAARLWAFWLALAALLSLASGTLQFGCVDIGHEVVEVRIVVRVVCHSTTWKGLPVRALSPPQPASALTSAVQEMQRPWPAQIKGFLCRRAQRRELRSQTSPICEHPTSLLRQPIASGSAQSHCGRDLSSNAITWLLKFSFVSFPKLRSLKLGHNVITRISRRVFLNQTELASL